MRNDTTISVYTYDDNGNRLSHTSLFGTVFGTYDDQDRLLSYGSVSYGYTAKGSLKFKSENGDTTFYTYDNLGNLISVILPDGTDIEYLIDGQNRRVGKKVDGVLQKQWIYQDQLNPVAEFDGAGNLVARFVYGDKGHVPSYMVKGGEVYRIVTDHLGSVRAVVNVSTGQVMQEIVYDEFGNVLLNTNPVFQPFAYGGGLYDEQTNLVKFGFRDYDATVGRWTVKDPIGFWGMSSNFYSYLDNDPINRIDPWGLVKFKKGINDEGVKEAIKGKYKVFDDVFKKYNEPEPTITSTTVDKHKKESKHYLGEACDIRGKDLSDETMKNIADDLQKELGPDYDVVPEYYPDNPDWDHVHIEYDPKK